MKFLKDTKVGYWRMGERWRDEWGVWHSATLEHVTNLWAHLQGVGYEAEFGAGAWQDKPIIKLTIERPRSSFEVRLYDYIKHRGKFYQIKHVDELSGRPGHDMKITCEYTSDVSA